MKKLIFLTIFLLLGQTFANDLVVDDSELINDSEPPVNLFLKISKKLEKDSNTVNQEAIKQTAQELKVSPEVIKFILN
jgi:hypothetical protein